MFPALLAATVLSLGAAQGPQGPADHPIVLTPAQRATLTSLGWPPAPPKIRPRDDLIFRRADQPPVSGSLTALHAFATVTTARGTTRIPRDDIGLILVNRHLIPHDAPALPLDSDAVLLANGRDVVVGRVEVDGEAIHVAARTVQQSDVALIHLHDPKSQEQQQAQEAGNASAPTAHGAPAPSRAGAPARTSAAPPPGAAPVPKGPGEIPWGKALWRGSVEFSRLEQSTPREEAHGTYYITWSEEADAPSPPAYIKLHPVSLTYQYAWTIAADPQHHCSAASMSKQGAGIDGVYPDIHSGGVLHLELMPGGPPSVNVDAGEFLINVFSPTQFGDDELPVNCDPAFSTPRVSQMRVLPDAILESQMNEQDCTSRPAVQRAPKPFVTIAGEMTCGTLGNEGFPYKTLKWRFDRGIPPSDPTMAQDRCETPRALLSLSESQRAGALARFQRLRDEFAKATTKEAQLRRTRNQLQSALDLLLVASAGADVGKRLLELVTSDDMLETAASTGQITEAQQEFVKQLNGFIDAYKEWTDVSDDAGEWGKSQLLDDARNQTISDDHQEMIDAALEMFNDGQILAAAIGQGNGEAAGDYIEENLGAFGPLVPEYALSKARQYVEVSKQWSEAMRDLAGLAARGVQLAGQIAELDLSIKTRKGQLQDCND